MARMGGSRHLKRHAAPRVLKLPRKEKVWTMKAVPGPHPLNRSIPLGILLRDYLQLGGSLKEVSKIIREGKVFVDGRPIRELKFPVGLMDVLSLPATGQHFRILPNTLGRLFPHPIGAHEAGFKLCRVETKKVIQGGRVQLGLHDGRNLLASNDFRVREVVKISLPGQEVLERIPFRVGCLALIIGGKNIGKMGRIVEIKELRSIQPNTAVLETDGEKIETQIPPLFLIGEKEPLISLP